LRLLFGLMYAHPGKKLLFMGQEIAQWREWDYKSSLDWHLLNRELHKKLQKFVKDLNTLYRKESSLYLVDFRPAGFEWIDFHDVEKSIISFIRKGKDLRDLLIFVFNFTPIPRENYKVGVPFGGFYREVLNSDSQIYGGSNTGNMGGVFAENLPFHGRPFSLTLTLPPLGMVVLKPEEENLQQKDEGRKNEP